MTNLNEEELQAVSGGTDGRADLPLEQDPAHRPAARRTEAGSPLLSSKKTDYRIKAAHKARCFRFRVRPLAARFSSLREKGPLQNICSDPFSFFFVLLRPRFPCGCGRSFLFFRFLFFRGCLPLAFAIRLSDVRVNVPRPSSSCASVRAGR